ncbi:MAG: hypothetical protein A3F72_13100 [Bacteroidetes bacterium RIFCSPLOWO2_12_FULL_35_15]|nr:MAG: hypothetical protein A3F72_13100 [Bacteroidetes bacterium RIFCSPLOWO2_12_FULL_35_15]
MAGKFEIETSNSLLKFRKKKEKKFFINLIYSYFQSKNNFTILNSLANTSLQMMYFWCMELILKQPINKPACICILFDRVIDSEKLNSSWLKHKEYFFLLTFEIDNSNLDIILKQEELGLTHRYKNVSHFPDKLFRFLYNTKDSEVYNFCHITAYYDKHILAKASISRTNWVLKVERINVLKEK